MAKIIGLDIGHSAVKVAFGDHLLLPAAVTRATALNVAASVQAAVGDTVVVDGKEYFVGKTAMIHSAGRLADGLSDDWTASEDHAVLIRAGYQKAIHAIGEDPELVVLGLPSRLHAQQKERLRSDAAAILPIDKGNVRVVPQALAAYYGMILDEDGGLVDSSAVDEKWVILDVGYYTTDFGFVDGGVWSAAGQESTTGTFTAAKSLAKRVAAKLDREVTTREAEVMLRTRSVRDMGNVVDLTDLVDLVVADTVSGVIDAASATLGQNAIRSANHVLVAGGGASLVFPAVEKVWKHAVCADQARFAIAEGMYRFGLAEYAQVG